MLKVANSVISASRITGVLPVVNGGTGVTTSTGTGNTVLSASPTLSGDVNFSTGNVVIGTAGKGIDFSADPSAAGMTSELFDDYEEGTWTPADASGAGLAITVNQANYTKVGNVVTAQFYIIYPATANVNGAAITLPFVPKNIFQQIVIGYTNSIVRLGAVNTGGNGHLYFYDGGAAPVANAGISTNFIICTFVYLT